MVAAELGDGFETLAAREDGDDGETEDGRQGADQATAAARVGDIGEGPEQGDGGHKCLRIRTGVSQR